MSYGLSLDAINKLQQLFSNYDVIEEVIIYGSRAKGNYREGSDIDVTVKGNKIDLLPLNKIKSDIDDLLLPYKIDLSVYTKITNEDLKEHISRVGKLFYKKGA